jgi:hypothetical protein
MGKSDPIRISSIPHWRRGIDDGSVSPMATATVMTISPQWSRSNAPEHAPSTSTKMSFLDVMSGQQYAKAVDTRVRSKSMKAIQLEERALKELWCFREHANGKAPLDLSILHIHQSTP